MQSWLLFRAQFAEFSHWILLFFYLLRRKNLMCEGKFFPFVLGFLSLYRTINITYPVLKKSHGSKRGILCVLVKLLYFTRMSIHPYFLYTLLFPAHFIQFDAARLVKMRFIHLHTVKNCGSFCGASFQEPDNCRPLDAQ